MKRIVWIMITLLFAASVLVCILFHGDAVWNTASHRLIKKGMVDFSILKGSEEHTITLISTKIAILEKTGEYVIA